MKHLKSLSYRKIVSFFALIFSIVLWMRCSMEHLIEDESLLKEGDAKVKLHVVIPDLNPTPLASRASEIANMMVMTFETTSGFFYMKDTPQPCIIEFADTPDESYYVATLNATTDPRLVVIVANASAALLSYTYTVDVTTLADVEAFKTQVLSTTIIGGTTYITQQPEIACMEGRVTLPSIQNGMIITDSSNPVPLTRGTAQIVVDSSPVPATDLEILGASLCNAPLRGFIFPQTTIATSGEAHYHYTSSSTTFLPFVGAASTQKSEPLYCYEDSKDNGLFVLLEANYKGVHGYYRINMVDGVLNDFDYDRNPIDIVRNTLYTVNIYKASNYGYTTITEAINNRASNIEYTVTAYVPSSEQYEDAHDIIHNGDYFLGVSNSAFISYGSGATGVIATTLTHSATATVTTATISVSGTGLTLVSPSTGTFNPGDATKKFNIEVSMSATFTTGTITIVLGNITKVITVEQRPPIPFVAGVVDDFAIGNEHFTGMLIPVGGVKPNWLKFSSAADGSNAVEEIANLAGKIYIVHDHNIVNSGGATRNGFVYITRDDEKGRVKALFNQSFLNTDEITDDTPTTVNMYVGAFWKSNQTGERLIRILRPTASSEIDGRWTAVVMEGDSWIKLDKMMPSDPGVWTSSGPSMDGNDPGFDALYSVMGTATSVFGRMTSSAPNNEIYFRIGLRNTYMPTSMAPARYGIVLLASAEGTVLQRIWIRQGEEPDYVMRPGDKDGSNNTVAGAEDRAYAQQWSPYNLTAGTLDAQVDIPGATPPVNPSLFTNYPSQGGAGFFWASTTNIRYAFYPLTASSGITIPTGYWNTLGAVNETCPPGYRRPNDGTISAYNTTGLVSESEYRQSLWLDPPILNANSVTNSTWGFYADGFFDRREIVPSISNVANSTVSYYASNPSDPRNRDVAYIGRLFFNPTSYESLFFPAAGYGLVQMGSMAHYWTSTIVNSARVFGFIGTVNEASLNNNSSIAVGCLSIRCIFGDPPSLNVNPNNLFFAWNNTTSSETVTVTTNQSSWSTSSSVGWLTIVPNSGGFTVVPNSTNTTGAIRTATITVTAGPLIETVSVMQGFDESIIPPTPTRQFSNPYIGAFWRASEMGERIIRITNVTGYNVGQWYASVSWMDGRWATGDIVLATGHSSDPGVTYNAGTESPGSAENPLYAVSGNAQWVGDYTSSGSEIVFRIGLKSKFSDSPQFASNPTYPYTTHYPVRYAIVSLYYGDPVMVQKIFLRQGEDPDYLMRPSDLMTVPTESISNAPRPEANKFSPYNLTATSMNAPVRNTYGTPPSGDPAAIFTLFPTQNGALFQWANNVYTRYAWAPIGNAPSWDSTYPLDYWMGGTSNNLYLTHETCPVGYTLSDGATQMDFRRFNDGITDANNSSLFVVGSEIRQSLPLIPASGSFVTNENPGNMVRGYYADGFFDRREIVTPTLSGSAESNSAVSATGNDIAFKGDLFYNPATNASLFFPTGGVRNYTDGSMNMGGYRSQLWSSTSSGSGQGSQIAVREDVTINMYAPSKSYGYTIRCVYDAPYLKLSPNNLNFTYNATTTQTVTVTTNLPSWSLSGVPSWLTVTPSSGTGNGSFTVVPNSNNPSVTPRSVTITVTASGLTASLTVNQDGEPPLFTVSPTSMNFAYNATGSANEQTATVTTNLGSWTVTGMPAWLTLNATSGSGNGTFTIVPNANNTTANPRTVTLTVTSGGLTQTIRVTQGVYVGYISGGGTPPSNVNTYVGAFWKADQVGERIIRIEVGTTASNLGDWSASVAWMDARWSAGDIVLSTDLVSTSELNLRGVNFTANATPQDPELWPVAGSATTVDGTVASGEVIIFRIGLKSKFSDLPSCALQSPNFSSTFPARYAVITLSYGNPIKTQKIFLRQGEGDDYAPGLNSSFRWSAYNLGNANNRAEFNNNGFAAYPTQIGYMYQWGHSTTDATIHPYPAHTAPSWAATINFVGGLYTLGSACPSGYRIPSAAATMRPAPNDYFFNMIWSLNDASGMWSAGNSSIQGYYADGFFDRRFITAFSPASYIVSTNNAEIASWGNIIVNQSSNKSLFFCGVFWCNWSCIGSTYQTRYAWASFWFDAQQVDPYPQFRYGALAAGNSNTLSITDPYDPLQAWGMFQSRQYLRDGLSVRCIR